MASICGSPVCAGGKPKMKFTYTGDYVVRKDGVVELLTSGTIVFLEPRVIDVFLVGGGGSGYSMTSASKWAGPGGGGGYTRTVRKVNVNANTEIHVTIGAGGASPNRSGGASGFNTLTVDGGKRAEQGAGGAGGSGGGGSVMSNSDYGVGGSDGANGESGYPVSVAGGKGQGFSAREFGEATGKLYAGGGGGGRYMSATSPVVSAGGSGGGGTGGFQSAGAVQQAAAAGTANTGGGGGGGAGASSTLDVSGASGGSGIVCFRDSVELPELAGTWVLHDKLYAPLTTITYNGNGTVTTKEGSTTLNMTEMVLYPQNVIIAAGPYSRLQVYTFANNTWDTSIYKSPLNTYTFPAGATASDEFLAWLASNATKQ